MKQVSQAPQRPSSINPQVSPALDAVVMRALEKDPGQRFQSAEAFIAALDAALRDPGAQGSATAAFAPLPPVVATVGEADGERDPEEEERRRRRRWIIAAVVAAIVIGALLGLVPHPRHDHERARRDRELAPAGRTAPRKPGIRRSATAAKSRTKRKPGPSSSRNRCPATPRSTAPSSASSARSRRWSSPSAPVPAAARCRAPPALSTEDAEAALEDAGFEAQLSEVNSEAVESGLVIKLGTAAAGPPRPGDRS